MAYSRFDSESAWREALGDVIVRARSELRVLDRDLSKMKLDAAATITAIEELLASEPTPRLLIAVHDPQPLRNQMPRLLRLAQRWEHAIELRQIPDHYRHLADCHALADAKHGARRFHIDHARGALLLDEDKEIAPWWRRFDELWAESMPISLGPLTGL